MAEEDVTLVDIDPNGDVLLQGLHPTKFRVSSKVLAQASDLFQTMMHHCEESIRFHFALSFGVRHRRVEDKGKDLYTLPFPLPLVGTEVSILFLDVLHHQTSTLPQKISLELVLGIGIMCDMYNCAEAFKPWSAMWLTGSEPEAAGDLGQSCYLLATAYVLDDADSFSRLSRNILREKDGSFSSLPIPRDLLNRPWNSVLSMLTNLKIFLH